MEFINMDLNKYLQSHFYERALNDPMTAMALINHTFYENHQLVLGISDVKKLRILFTVAQSGTGDVVNEYVQLFEQMDLLINDTDIQYEHRMYIGTLFDDCFRLFPRGSEILFSRDEYMPYNRDLDENVINDRFISDIVECANAEEDIISNDIAFYNHKLFTEYFIYTIFKAHKLCYVFDIIFNNLQYFSSGDLVPLLQFLEIEQGGDFPIYFGKFQDAFNEQSEDIMSYEIYDNILGSIRSYGPVKDNIRSVYDICLYIARHFKEPLTGKPKKTCIKVMSYDLAKNLQLTKELVYMNVIKVPIDRNCLSFHYDFCNIVCRNNVATDNSLIGWKTLRSNGSGVTKGYSWTNIKDFAPGYDEIWTNGMIFTDDPMMICEDDIVIDDTGSGIRRISKNKRSFAAGLLRCSNNGTLSDIIVSF